MTERRLPVGAQCPPLGFAAMIVEPIPHNVGARHALSGWQEISGVLPDLTTFGKAMGNGYPDAGLAGRRERTLEASRDVLNELLADATRLVSSPRDRAT